jgi:hypothetical protein
VAPDYLFKPPAMAHFVLAECRRMTADGYSVRCFTEAAMQIKVDGRNLTFAFDEGRGAFVAPHSLPAWAGFRSENSRKELTGERVLLILEPEDAESGLSDISCYATNIDWFLAHQDEVKASALAGISEWIGTLRDEYGIDDEELSAYSRPEQLGSMVDLSFVRIYPHRKQGKPYFGLEFECNWDPESGCGVMFHGAQVVETGVSDSVQGGFDIEGDGGKV